MRALHNVTAVIEVGAGLALLSWPSATVALLAGALPPPPGEGTWKPRASRRCSKQLHLALAGGLCRYSILGGQPMSKLVN